MRLPASHIVLAVLASICFTALSVSADTPNNHAQPNVVFIMADDVGLGDIGYYHTQRTGKPPFAATPNLDELAQAGMRFSDAHSSTALCSPTRYCAMTGNLNYRSYAPWGVWGSFRKSPVTDEDATLGRVSKQAGLTTGFIGKWHLGGDFMSAAGDAVYRGNDHKATPEQVDASRVVGGGPKELGFDYSLMLPCGIQGPLYTVYENGKWYPFTNESELIYLDDKTAGHPAYVSDKGPGVGDSHWDTRLIGPMLAQKAADFIKQNADAGQRFALVYWSPMVHIPHIPPAEFDGRKVKDQTPTRHMDMIIDLDQQVARIVSALKEAGVYENTLIIFSSDNGGLWNKNGLKVGHDASGGIRGFKNDPYEGGHRVPFFAVWPGKIQADSESDAMVAVHDVVATWAGLFGQALHEEQAKDSLNLMPLLLNEPGFEGRTEFLLQGGSRKEVIYRAGPWKLIIQCDWKLTMLEPVALFNLDENPLEKESGNLINDPEHTERVKAMHTRYIQIRQSGERTTPVLQ